MKHKFSIAICVVLIALTVGFVFHNSAKPTAESQQASEVVAETIENIAQKTDTGETKVSSTSVQYIRKAAHAVEFFALGLELSAFSLLVGRRKYNFQKFWNVLSVSLAVAVADESIQIFSGRGPAVRDVLIDLGGAAIGIVLTLLVHWIWISCRKGKRRYGKH